jgi:hypothetical protein
MEAVLENMQHAMEYSVSCPITRTEYQTGLLKLIWNMADLFSRKLSGT